MLYVNVSATGLYQNDEFTQYYRHMLSFTINTGNGVQNISPIVMEVTIMKFNTRHYVPALESAAMYVVYLYFKVEFALQSNLTVFRGFLLSAGLIY